MSNLRGCLVEVGDILFLAKEPISSIKIAFKDELEVVGFGTIIHRYFREFNKEPGVYMNNSWIKVKHKNNIHTISVHNLEPKDEELFNEREKQYQSGEYVSTTENVRVGNVPKTPFWQEDIVMLKSGEELFEGSKLMKVFELNYDYMDRFCNDGVTPFPYIDVSKFNYGEYSSGHTAIRERDIELVERGNVWKHYHDIPLKFNSVQEKADFYYNLGHCTEIKNEENGNYSWSNKQVLEGLLNGTIDYVGFEKLSQTSNNYCYKFNDPSIGLEVRQYSYNFHA